MKSKLADNIIRMILNQISPSAGAKSQNIFYFRYFERVSVEELFVFFNLF